MDLTDKVALVTGGAVRVGRAIALGLAKEGVKIGLHYNQSFEKAKQTKSEIESLGGEALLVQGDFSKVAQIDNVVNRCCQQFHRIDILINNAAIYFKTPLGETSEEQWDRFLDINLKGPFFCAQYVSEVMKKQESGKIVNIADVAGISPWPCFIPYSCSKAGVISMTKGLAKALAPNIQVNAIASGTVLIQEDPTGKLEKEVKELTLLKRIGKPEDIVNTVVYLLKGSDFITGEVITVDGGRHLV